MSKHDTSERVAVQFLPKEKQRSEYDWANIVVGKKQVGKARCSVSGRKLTIWSINVFSRFEGRGYARQAIDTFKEKFSTIVADRVRYRARGFWEKMGFADLSNGNWAYRR